MSQLLYILYRIKTIDSGGLKTGALGRRWTQGYTGGRRTRPDIMLFVA
jgi:hypothetical protein